MLYIKTRLNKKFELRHPLFDDEIFTQCVECGKEIGVSKHDILEILQRTGDLANASAVCKECKTHNIHDRQ